MITSALLTTADGGSIVFSYSSPMDRYPAISRRISYPAISSGPCRCCATSRRSSSPGALWVPAWFVLSMNHPLLISSRLRHLGNVLRDSIVVFSTVPSVSSPLVLERQKVGSDSLRYTEKLRQFFTLGYKSSWREAACIWHVSHKDRKCPPRQCVLQ
jgi:hypothetical protein